MRTAVGGCGPDGLSALQRTSAPLTISYRSGGSSVTGTGPGSAAGSADTAFTVRRAGRRAPGRLPREARSEPVTPDRLPNGPATGPRDVPGEPRAGARLDPTTRPEVVGVAVDAEAYIADAQRILPRASGSLV